MTAARQPPLFADCPYGGCEDGYCACLEQNVADVQAALDACGEIYAHRKWRIEDVPISIDDYESPETSCPS